MRDFEYVAPTSIDGAVQAFAGANGNARALAGGTDLIDQIRVGRWTPEIVIDMKRIPELNILEYSASTGLRIGAAVSLARVHNHPDVVANYPGVEIPTGFVGSVQIQNRGSIGGNIGNGAPSGDTISPLIALNATVTITGPRGQREEPLEGIFAGPGQLTLQPDEFLVEVKVPPPAPRSSSHYVRFIPRAEMDIAVAGVGVSMTVADGGRVEEVGIVLTSVAPTPVRATAAEGVVRGQQLTRDIVRQAGERAIEAASPISDVRGSAEYRIELVKVLTRRALASCAGQLGVQVD
ncbi:MAG: xanthine dehydrogenase family protein subunit M [Dehalococcoidia bacterium]|nr:xanthine dehydrogenase family protein subunit M [Dehalococcoidia bacterium]